MGVCSRHNAVFRYPGLRSRRLHIVNEVSFDEYSTVGRLIDEILDSRYSGFLGKVLEHGAGMQPNTDRLFAGVSRKSLAKGFNQACAVIGESVTRNTKYIYLGQQFRRYVQRAVR